MELLQEQMTQLAKLEKLQCQLMGRFIAIQQRVQSQMNLETTIATSTNGDGTNENNTAAAAVATTVGEFGIEASNENAEEIEDMDQMNQREQVMDANVDSHFIQAEIFSDADLALGAEEIVVDADVAAEDDQVGSLM